MNKNINLILSGTGTLYPCVVGAILCLAENGYSFKEVCGISGGSLVAGALATGYSPNTELIKFVKKTMPLKHNLIRRAKWNWFSDYSVVKTSNLAKYYDDYLVNNFSQAKIPLHVVTTNMQTGEHYIFNPEISPMERVSKAIMASMSTPILYKPFKIKGKQYVDGVIAPRLSANWDISNTIFVRVRSDNKNQIPVKGIRPTVLSILNSFIHSKNNEYVSKKLYAKTVDINSSFPCFNLNTTGSDVDKMVSEGYKAMKAWLENK